MHKATAAVILGSFLPAAMGHIAMWNPAAYGFNGNGYSLSEPLSNLPFDKWWFHGQKDNAPKDGATVDLPAGSSVTVELACNKEYTSYGGNGGGSDPCPPDTPSMHAGSPVKDSQLRGCGLAIAYKSNVNDVNPEDFTIFSVSHECVKVKNTVFEVPAGMPACPGGKCICAWFWQGQESSNEMYMVGFDCKVTNPGNKVLGKPQVPTECRNGEGCTSGPKQPQYWANNGGQNVKFSGEYERKPAYTEKWGFKNGAQTDIFTEGTQQAEGGEGDNGQTGELPEGDAPEETPKAPTPEGNCQAATVTVTETVTVSKRKFPKATGESRWRD